MDNREEKIRAAIEMRKEGKSIREIAQELDLGYSYVYMVFSGKIAKFKHLIPDDLPLRLDRKRKPRKAVNNPRGRFSDKDLEEMLKLKEGGLKYHEIGDKYQISGSYVSYLLHGKYPTIDFRDGNCGRTSKLTEKDWEDIKIRLKDGESVKSVAKHYNIDSSQIYRKKFK